MHRCHAIVSLHRRNYGTSYVKKKEVEVLPVVDLSGKSAFCGRCNTVVHPIQCTHLPILGSNFPKILVHIHTSADYMNILLIR